MTRREVAGFAVAGLAFGGLMLGIHPDPVPLSEVAADLGCITVTEQDEFARISGTDVDARCDLPSGQTVQVAHVIDSRAFRGYLASHPDLIAAYPSTDWRAVGTYAALDAAGLMTSEEG